MAFPIIWISTKANEMARKILKLIVLTAMIDPNKLLSFLSISEDLILSQLQANAYTRNKSNCIYFQVPGHI